MLASPNVSAPAQDSSVESLNFTALPPQDDDTAVLPLPVQQATDAVVAAIDAEALVISHLHLAPFAVNLAAKHLPGHHPYLDREDLESYAKMALMRVAKRYDPTCGATFATYAMRRLPGAVVDAIRENDWPGRAMRSKTRALKNVREALIIRLDREPTMDELAEALDITPDAVRALHADLARANVESTDVLGVPEAPAREETPEELLIRGEQAQFVHTAINALPPKHAQVIRGIFFDEQTKVSMGEQMGISSSRVHKILNEAIRLLHVGLSELHLGETQEAPARTQGERRHEEYNQQMLAAMQNIYPRAAADDQDDTDLDAGRPGEAARPAAALASAPLAIPAPRRAKDDYRLTA